MKFSQLIEYKKKNIFLRNQTDNEEARLVSHPFFLKKKKKEKEKNSNNIKRLSFRTQFIIEFLLRLPIVEKCLEKCLQWPGFHQAI